MKICKAGEIIEGSGVMVTRGFFNPGAVVGKTLRYGNR